MAMKISFRRYIILSLTLILLATSWAAPSTQAAVPKLDQIRVALFMQLPGKYTATTSAATFSSAGGMTIGSRQPAGVTDWFSVAGLTQVRFAADDYKVKLAETTNFNSALSIYKKMQGLGGRPYLVSLSKNGSIVYQVLEGTYKTVDEATTARGKWSGNSELAALTGGYAAELHGPLHMETGSFSSKSEAISAAASFGAAGLDAFIAVRAPQNGTARYSVMVGAASSDAELQIVKAAAAKASGGTGLNAADKQSPYMLLRNDHSISGKAESSMELYAFGGSDMKVSISPKGTEPIKLVERSNRTYRGLFELSVLNGQMAVVNELPFEQYLYSVVGVEMYASWPAEALKAQAVAARSYALNKGLGFQIAHVVDTTLSQAYYGTGSESASTIAAVDATAGEVAIYNGKVIEALFAANAGGMTADAKEIWNNSVPYLQPVKSQDSSSEKGLKSWYNVVLPNGAIGYIREDLLNDTGRKTAAGSIIMQVNTNGTKVRKHPVIQDDLPLIGQLESGSEVVVLEKVIESNSMSWIRGPYSSQELLTAINSKASSPISGTLLSLEVSKRGASGRAIEISANGQKLAVSYPDALRSTLGVQGSLPSTMFDIEETAKVALLGASSASRTKTPGSAVYTISAGGKVSEASGSHLFIMNGKGDIRASTKEPGFQFKGSGNGHGLGLSQYGALSLAQQGYDYQYILKYYYKDVTITKE